MDRTANKTGNFSQKRRRLFILHCVGVAVITGIARLIAIGWDVAILNRVTSNLLMLASMQLVH